MPTLPRILKPLDDNDALIDLMARVSGEPPQTVARRLLDEERCLGTNVRNDLKAFGLAPHEWSDRLIELSAKYKVQNPRHSRPSERLAPRRVKMLVPIGKCGCPSFTSYFALLILH